MSFAISEPDVASLDSTLPPLHAGPIATGLLDEIASASPRQRASLAVEAVTIAVAQVLGRTTPPIKDDRLVELGLDSLMALELRNRLQTTFGMNGLSSTVVFDYPTSEALASFLLVQLGYGANGCDADPNGHNAGLPADEIAAATPVHSEEELDRMSEDEIAELLRMQLEP